MLHLLRITTTFVCPRELSARGHREVTGRLGRVEVCVQSDWRVPYLKCTERINVTVAQNSVARAAMRVHAMHPITSSRADVSLLEAAKRLASV